jgi:hypothetical protein
MPFLGQFSFRLIKMKSGGGCDLGDAAICVRKDARSRISQVRDFANVFGGIRGDGGGTTFVDVVIAEARGEPRNTGGGR